MGRRKLDQRELETAMLGVGYLLGGAALDLQGDYSLGDRV